MGCSTSLGSGCRRPALLPRSGRPTSPSSTLHRAHPASKGSRERLWNVPPTRRQGSGTSRRVGASSQDDRIRRRGFRLRLAGRIYSAGFRAWSAANALVVFNSVSGVLTYLVIFATVAYVLGGGVSTGEFVAFNTAFAQFLFASAGITTAFTTILQAAPFYERAKPILRTLPEVDTEKPDPGVLRGRVEVNHVSFRYDPDGPLVLDDVSLRAEPGEFVAIVGPSGAGKSSLFRQLLGFEEPEAGSVYYDHHNLAELNVQAVRRQMGVVLQNGRLMSGSIFQNIAGVSALTLDQAWEAARMAGLDEDIQMMPMGMFTFLGEGSRDLRRPAPEVDDSPGDRLQTAHSALRRSDQRPGQPLASHSKLQPSGSEGHPHSDRPQAEHHN